MNNKRYYFSIFILQFCIASIYSQSIHIGFGPIFTKSKAIAPIINASEDFSNTAYVKSISYEHFIKSKKISLIGSYSNFCGYTYVNFQVGGYQDPWGNSFGGTGFAGVKIHRLDLLMGYNLMKSKRYYLKPIGGLGLQVSRERGVGLLEVPVNGPDYIQTEPMIADPYNTFQIVPTLGLKTGFVFWKHLDIGFQVQGVLGYKPYQKLTLKYKYKGVLQPDAIYASDGTGIYYTLTIGYRFAKFIK